MAVGLCGCDLPIPDAVRLDPGAPVVVDAKGVSWGGVRLERLEAVLFHGVRYEDPVLPPAEPACDWSLWQAGTVIRQQRYSCLFSARARLEQVGGVRLYNPLSTELAAFDRFGQLDRLGRAGFAVPSLLVSNNDGKVAAFQRRNDGVELIWRPVTGQAAWQLFRDRQRSHLVGPDKPPVLLAAVVPGRVLRVYVLDGRVVLVLAMLAPNRDGLERLEGMMAVEDLAPERLETIARAVSALGLRRAAALVVDGADGPVFHDIDPDPELSDLPPVFEEYLKRCLAAALTGTPMPAPDFGPEPVERSSLLLRRMLAIQFDMEATKYAE
ncbi:MAG: hypothetical protein WCF85_06490 [Rhodospirillaceae bacterium]